MIKNRPNNKTLAICLDMYGCPNRCQHCWLGDLPNNRISKGIDDYIVSLFKPYFKDVTFYSWIREPDFTRDYKARWVKDNELSSIKPQRFELASFYKIVRDPEYVKWLKEVGTNKVQLTFFGLETLTDKYIGRIGAYRELIETTKILKNNEIEPRWQIFINEENRDDVVRLLDVAKKMNVSDVFVHEGSCDGNNRKLYDIRINKNNIPKEVKPHYLNYEKILSEKECIEILKNDTSHFVPTNNKEVILYITSDLNIYFNFTNPSPAWKIGNIKHNINELLGKVINEDVPALKTARTIAIGELVKLYGDLNSNKVFALYDYKMYLLNNYLDEKYKN
ncbi:MAG: radical SAM protein [Bacilli bacterium]|jgi:hypothetical protein